ncbi:MAG TPA: flagellar biosynthesis anti-sigma factor FlgM [Tepidisphaeraceae bacterium]|jgi:anti-sigma28 factor (negative regulator of flagellin synthesis)|nr:flagellar biosynthesis anti-sigma factor FlgM [Tepidisphaeraceae bacterium]HEV8606449.1 flagellar biosynthesis anti-sigma factor FlgM [Tepidisphaeraceae bacterium]
MSGINPVGSGWNIQSLTQQPILKSLSQPSGPKATDRLELSGNTHLLTALRSNEVRIDKVSVIKAQIDAGSYESSEKLDIAIDRMLDEILR